MKRDFVGLFMMLTTVMLFGMSSQRAAIHLGGDASSKLQETRTPTPTPTVSPTPAPSPSPRGTPTPAPEPEPAPNRSPTPGNFRRDGEINRKEK
jgi:hypothetical protein